MDNPTVLRLALRPVMHCTHPPVAPEMVRVLRRGRLQSWSSVPARGPFNRFTHIMATMARSRKPRYTFQAFICYDIVAIAKSRNKGDGMSHQDRNFPALMRERGFRVTPQRQMILDAVCEGGGHSTPEQIYERVQARAPAVNRATVYRNLSFLCDLRMILNADMGNGHLAYEIAPESPHHHLVCRRCGKAEQISHGAIDELFAKIDQEYGFSVDREHLMLTGLCRQCRQGTA